MSTVFTGSLNTYSDGVSGGTGYPGDADTGHGQRQFASYVDPLEPHLTPFFSKVAKGKAVWKSKLEGGVRVQMPHRVTLGEALDTSETAIDLASGHGAYVHDYMVIYIPVDATGNDAEVVWVTAGHDFTDTVDVIRAQGGTTGVAHDTGTVCEVIGVAVPDLADYPTAPVIWGNLHYNYRQRFSKEITVDAAEDIQHNWEDPDGNIFERKLATIAKDLKLQFEKALLLGRRQAGAPTSGSVRAGMLSGVDHFAELSGNTDDLAGALLNIYDLEAAIRDRVEEVDANYGDTAIFNYSVQAMLDTAFNLKREATMSDTTANLQLTSVRFGAGSISFLPLPSNRFPEPKIDIVRFSDLKYYPYEGLDWDFFRKEMGVNTDGSYEIGSISGDFNFLPTSLDPMFQITGFESDLDFYPSDLSV